MTNSDTDWILWGERDPYFAVITDDRFRGGNLTPEAKAIFFESGRAHVEYMLGNCRRLAGADFKPRSAVDFGCGVGRVVVPLSAHCEHVVGIDVSPAMLLEAQNNCEARGATNVEFLLSDNDLSSLVGRRFDLVHSCIVFQHIDIPRGRRLFGLLLDKLNPGGCGAIQVTFGKAWCEETYGQPAVPELPKESDVSRPQGLGTLFRKRPMPAESVHAWPSTGDPGMQMNPYNLSELAFLLHRAGIKEFHAEFTDHGGELGVFLFFRMPGV